MKTKPKTKEIRYKNIEQFIDTKLQEASEALKNVDLSLLRKTQSQG